MAYASFAEARETGAVERGWVPSVLPPDAYELRAAYDPGGLRRWGLFNFHPESADALRGVLEPAEARFEGVRIDIPPRIEWWPVALRGSLDHDALAMTGLRAYRVAGASMMMAVNWKQGRGYYWATSP